jgi:hypothetical protein
MPDVQSLRAQLLTELRDVLDTEHVMGQVFGLAELRPGQRAAWDSCRGVSIRSEAVASGAA